MSNLTFQITPDSNKDSETIQMGRDLKLSCHVDATPQDKVNYTWYKNGAPVFNSDSLILLRSDPDMAPGTSSLEIVDMKFRDLATYSCMASFSGSTVRELRVDVNISQNSGKSFPFFLVILCLCQTEGNCIFGLFVFLIVSCRANTIPTTNKPRYMYICIMMAQ